MFSPTHEEHKLPWREAKIMVSTIIGCKDTEKFLIIQIFLQNLLQCEKI